MNAERIATPQTSNNQPKNRCCCVKQVRIKHEVRSPATPHTLQPHVAGLARTAARKKTCIEPLVTAGTVQALGAQKSVLCGVASQEAVQHVSRVHGAARLKDFVSVIAPDFTTKHTFRFKSANKRKCQLPSNDQVHCPATSATFQG